MGLWALVRSDLARYEQTFELRGERAPRRRIFLESFLFKAGFQAVLLYRLSHALWRSGWGRLAWALTRFSVAVTGAEIEYNVQIGQGFMIPHPVGIVLGRGSKIGAGVTVFQGVTLGAKDWAPARIGEFPTIGDESVLFAGAKVLGAVAVGRRCVVGANAVVIENLPDGALAVGVPARVVPDRGRGMIQGWFGGSGS